MNETPRKDKAHAQAPRHGVISRTRQGGKQRVGMHMRRCCARATRARPRVQLLPRRASLPGQRTCYLQTQILRRRRRRYQVGKLVVLVQLRASRKTHRDAGKGREMRRHTYTQRHGYADTGTLAGIHTHAYTHK